LLVGLVLSFSPLSGQPVRVERKMNIDLTDREIELLMGCVGTNIETIKRRHDPTDPMIAGMIEELFELENDLRAARQDDRFGIDAEINAEAQMFNAGVEARERMKKMRRSETQSVDLWNPNDPKNW